MECVQNERHSNEGLRRICLEIAFQCLHSSVHDTTAALEDVVCNSPFIDVPRRQQRENLVRWSQLQDILEAVDLIEDVRMGQCHALRQTRRPRCVHDCGDTPRSALDRNLLVIVNVGPKKKLQLSVLAKVAS